MTEHDVLVGFRLRLFTLADELGNVSAACRAMGVDRSTYYRWKRKVDRWGLEALAVRERRRPRMPNQIGPHLEQKIIAFALGHPGLGPRRISAELAREKWGGVRISEHGIWLADPREPGVGEADRRCARRWLARRRARRRAPGPRRRRPRDGEDWRALRSPAARTTSRTPRASRAPRPAHPDRPPAARARPCRAPAPPYPATPPRPAPPPSPPPTGGRLCPTPRRIRPLPPLAPPAIAACPNGCLGEVTTPHFLVTNASQARANTRTAPVVRAPV